jgi:hypothetical protein
VFDSIGKQVDEFETVTCMECGHKEIIVNRENPFNTGEGE